MRNCPVNSAFSLATSQHQLQFEITGCMFVPNIEKLPRDPGYYQRPANSQAWAGGFRGGLLPGAVTSLGFLVAGGRGGISGACGGAPPGGSGARRTGWRGANVSWFILGREADPTW